MKILLLYLAGYTISAALLVYIKIKRQHYITISDICAIIIFSLMSWVLIADIIIDKISNKIIFKTKKYKDELKWQNRTLRKQ